MASDEGLQVKYTATLQRIDSNFVKAIDSACGLLNEAKVFDSNMRTVSNNCKVWGTFFDNIAKVNVKLASAATSAKVLVTDCKSSQGAKRKADEKSEISDTSSEIVTPTLPVTLANKRLRTGSDAPGQDSMISEEDGDEPSFLKQLSPGTIRMVEAYKTPMQRPVQTADAKSAVSLVGASSSAHASSEVSEQISASSGSENKSDTSILNLSSITPSTPDTPTQGFDEEINSRAAELVRYGTPAKRVAEMLLGSAMRSQIKPKSAARDQALSVNSDVNISRVSSNPATPQMDSPLANRSAMLDEEEQLDTGTEKENAGANQHATPPLQKPMPTSILKRSGIQSHKFAAGTPISQALATKRRRSLATSHKKEKDGTALLSEDEHDDILTNGDLDDQKELIATNMIDMDERPTFSLELFPAVFRHGEGAAQITKVYSQFDNQRAFDLKQLSRRLPGFSQKRIELLLELLVTKGLLRPFQLEEQLLWRMPLD